MVVFKRLSYLCLSFVILSVTIVMIAIATFSNSSTKKITTRIIGGQDAPDGKYPYLVSLRRPRNRHFCGGSIINKRWILTAAHCLKNKWDDSVTVVAGTNLIRGGIEQAYQSEHLAPHKNYESYNRHLNDIGLIRVNRNIKFNSKVRPIKLPKSNINKPNYHVTIAGWGRVIETGGIPNQLQEITLKIVDQRECKEKIRQLHDSQICTFTKFGEGTCYGDSGSPLVADGVQIGIVSHGGADHCAAGAPDIFVRVYSYLSWIKTQMRNYKLNQQ